VLVGRKGELGEVRRLVEGLRDGRGGALLLHGEAGIGKTALLESARDMAGHATVLECQGIESESNLSFSALRDLIWPVVEERSELPEPQQRALGGALALGPPAPGDRLAVCVATLGVLEAAAARGPVLALVDDFQWLDDASRECVTYVARRAHGPIALLLSARDGHGRAGWEGIPSAELRPLDRDASAQLLTKAAPGLAPGVLDAIAAAADGNPLALVELPATLTPEQWHGSAPLERPIAPGRGLERVYSARLAELAGPTSTALLVAAACDTDQLGPVAAACDALGCSAEALHAAEDVGLVRLRGDRLAFEHPLVRGAVYHGAPAAQRRRAHRALAGVVDGEARAWHLASAAVGPDEAAAAALEQAAGTAAARRAYAAAADALQRSARLSPDAAQSTGRLLGAGAAALGAGRAAEAAALAEEAGERAADPFTRAAANHLRAVVALWSGRVVEAMGLLEQSADGIAEASPDMAALALAEASFACCAAGDCPRALALAERAHGVLGDSADPAIRAPVLAILGWTLVLRGQTRRARPIMDDALKLAPELDPFSPAAQLVWIALNCRLPTEDYEGTLADGLATAAAARDAGSLYALPTPLCMAAAAAHRLGRWDEVEEMCGEATTAAEETDQWGPAATAAFTRARVAAARGHEAECRADTTSALALAESAGVGSLAVYCHGVLGFLELSMGRVAAAIEELELTERLVAESQLDEPTIIPWAPDLVEAYVRAGRVEPARRVLATLARQADLADTAGAAALAERCRGLVADAGFDDHFALALEHDERGPMPFERARTQLAWGMRLHRARRRVEAREKLRAAVEAFERIGAAAWEELARAELRAAGGRQRRPLGDSLTAQEERVARAAGRGATTQEIAADLFLSPKTVEFHLGRAYRKLGVRSRAELANVLASGELSAETASSATRV
jgi:DNA-binding CsgD family transcriptional regulator